MATDPGEGAVRVCAVVAVEVVKGIVALVVDVVTQVVAFTRQLAGLRARMVVHRSHDADRKLDSGAADGHHTERHRRRHLQHKYHRRRRRRPHYTKKSPCGHHRTTLSGYMFATKARIDKRKKC